MTVTVIAFFHTSKTAPETAAFMSGIAHQSVFTGDKAVGTEQRERARQMMIERSRLKKD